MADSTRSVLKSQDFLAGLMFAGIGGFGLFLSLQFPLGTTRQMGPGYFPSLVSGLLIIFGLLTAAQAAVAATSHPFEGISVRPFIFVIGSALLFSFGIEPLGLIISVALLIFLSRLSESPLRLREVFILTVVMCAISVFVFYYGLGLPFGLLPT